MAVISYYFYVSVEGAVATANSIVPYEKCAADCDAECKDEGCAESACLFTPWAAEKHSCACTTCTNRDRCRPGCKKICAVKGEGCYSRSCNQSRRGRIICNCVGQCSKTRTSPDGKSSRRIGFLG